MSSEYEKDEYYLNDDEIEKFTAFDLLKRVVDIYSDDDEVHREVLKGLFLTRAAQCGNEKSVRSAIAKCEKASAELQPISVPQFVSEIDLIRDGNGRAMQTIENVYRVMRNDPFYAGVKFNIVRNAPEVQFGNPPQIRRWSDTDAAESLRYLEDKYKIYSSEKHTAALRLLFRDREYNPIIDVLSTVRWDGKERCEDFLCKWAKADNTPYVREVSRLIFAGGIWRLLQPGCKFDDVPILIGNQGSGKSSLCRFIAINDDYFGEVKDVEGQGAIEQIQGKWICEIQELAAMTKAREIEAIKAYITRQRDQYRKPYDKEPCELLRRCIFIGTSNNRTPLIDRSGNRRFYPVEVRSIGYEVFDAQEEIREYAIQCWAEAWDKYRRNEMPNFAKKELRDEYKAAQDNALQDDWRVGAVKAFLDDLPQGHLVCAREIMHKALSADPEHPRDPSMRDSKEIGEIMLQFSDEWEKAKTSMRTAEYGIQRVWKKISDATIDQLPF